jgi:hypothetical protein
VQEPPVSSTTIGLSKLEWNEKRRPALENETGGLFLYNEGLDEVRFLVGARYFRVLDR